MLQVIFQNFLSFDFIIFVLALLNTYVLVMTVRYSKKLYDTLNPYCWIPGGEASLKEIQGKFAKRSRADGETDIINLRRKMNSSYVVYENLTAIFPLLGLLGTVVSLIPLVDDMGDVPTGLFFSALTSTMWGIIFAIIFKVANGYVASGIEDNEKNIDIYLQRNTDKVLKMRALAASAATEEPAAETVSEETTAKNAESEDVTIEDEIKTAMDEIAAETADAKNKENVNEEA